MRPRCTAGRCRRRPPARIPFLHPSCACPPAPCSLLLAQPPRQAARPEPVEGHAGARGPLPGAWAVQSGALVWRAPPPSRSPPNPRVCPMLLPSLLQSPARPPLPPLHRSSPSTRCCPTPCAWRARSRCWTSSTACPLCARTCGVSVWLGGRPAGFRADGESALLLTASRDACLPAHCVHRSCPVPHLPPLRRLRAQGVQQRRAGAGRGAVRAAAVRPAAGDEAVRAGEGARL